MNQEIAKAGWMFRKSTILKKWKKNWFVLYIDGTLKYYESSTQNSAEDAISMNIDCSDVLSEMKNVNPPDYLDRSCLLGVVKNNGDVWTLCAESADDKQTWEFVLNDARLLLPPAPPYSNAVYPRQQNLYQAPVYGQYPTNPQGYNIQYPNQGYQYAQYPNNTVVVYPDRYRRRYGGVDMTTGLVTGALMGSMLGGPMLWW